MRVLKSEERALWHATMRDVKPLRRAKPAAAKPAAARAEPTAKPRRAPPTGTETPAKKPIVAKHLGTLDRRSARRLKRGTLPIEARLDLHGMTQSEAHDALTRFLARAQGHASRAVLVITGKSGVLHGAVPRWLQEGENRDRILAIRRAHAQHGGDGALYLMLRRRR